MQPVSNSQYTKVSGTAAGTTVVADRNCAFDRVVIGTTTTGTVDFYDVATAAGTTAGNHLFTLVNNAGTAPANTTYGIQCKNGLVAVIGGTTNMLVVWN